MCPPTTRRWCTAPGPIRPTRRTTTRRRCTTQATTPARRWPRASPSGSAWRPPAALWGNCNWGGGDVNINVNRYNSMNTNRQIDANQTNFQHNAANRRGVPTAIAAASSSSARTSPARASAPTTAAATRQPRRAAPAGAIAAAAARHGPGRRAATNCATIRRARQRADAAPARGQGGVGGRRCGWRSVGARGGPSGRRQRLARRGRRRARRASRGSRQCQPADRSQPLGRARRLWGWRLQRGRRAWWRRRWRRRRWRRRRRRSGGGGGGRR